MATSAVTNPTPTNTNSMSTAAAAFSPSTTGRLTGQEQTLSSWAAPYTTGMLGKAQALSETPYQVYQGPLTAGESPLQRQYFQGIGQIGFPSLLGQSFSAAGAPVLPRQQPFLTQGQPQDRGRVDDFNRMMSGIPGMPTMPTQTYGGTLGGFAGGTAQLSPDAQTPLGQQMLADMKKYASPVNQFGGQAQPSMAATGAAAQPSGIAANYMNPYLSAALAPSLDEARRQAEISRVGQAGRLTQAGAYGGGRQAIMESELNRNLMQAQNKMLAEGYATAYDKAMQQFNTEQGQAMGLANLLGSAGAAQRGIEAEGVAADKAEFEAQRDYPYKQLQFQQSMLQNMPFMSQNYAYQEPSGFSDLLTGAGGLMDLYERIFGKAPATTATTTTTPR